MADCVFCKIINKEIPATIYYEDDDVMAIKNINPEAPFHALIIPKEHLELDKLTDSEETLGKLFLAAKNVAEKENLSSGYRLIVNNGPDSGQEIDHLHIHMLGGKNLGPNLCP